MYLILIYFQGYESHILSAASEWAIALCLLIFFATYISDFKKISLSSPELRIIIRRVPTSNHAPLASDV